MLMTWTEAIERWDALLEHDDALIIRDNSQDWNIGNLVDAVRSDDDGTTHDLIVERDGITPLDARGYRLARTYWLADIASGPGSMLRCLRCSGDWRQRGDSPPERCPKCNSPYWDRPRTKGRC